MRIAMYYNNNDIRLEEMPIPKISPDELLVKVVASGICGSDVLEWYRLKKAPLVLGHEIAGEIVEVGSAVKQFQAGDRVFASHHVPCNTCYYCLNGDHTLCKTLSTTTFDPGGFSEYLRLPAINVNRGTFILPDELSYEAGVFIEPLACVIRGQRRSNFKPGQSVLILGSGISGLLHLLYAKSQGADRIITTDIVDYRLKFALKSDADNVINAKEDVPEFVKYLTGKRGADLVVVCTDAVPAFKQAFESVRAGGTILFYAPTPSGFKLSFDFNEFWSKQINLTSTYANSPDDATIAVELIRSGRINVTDLITHRLKLSETGEGFKIMTSAGDSMKIVVEPQQ